MPHDSTQEFDFGLEAEEFDFDPLAEQADDGTSETAPESEDAATAPAKTADAFDGSSESEIPKAPMAPHADDRPASQRIADLFNEMSSRRRVMLDILRFLQEPQSADALKDEVERLQEHDYSVYDSADYARLLEEAGAIEKVDPDGSELDETGEVKPSIVEIDGVEYYKPADGRPTYWSITEDGQEYLESDKPLERLYELLDEEKQYAPIYRWLLSACAEGEGLSAPQISAKIDKDPLVQKPRMCGPHFTQRLEKCDALRWEGKWRTTDIGKQGLERLGGAIEDEAPETSGSQAQASGKEGE